MYKARLAYRTVQQAILRKDWAEAQTRAKEMIVCLTQEKVHDPLIELTLTGKFLFAMLEILFNQNSSEARKQANDYAAAIITSNLRSDQIGYNVLKLTDRFAKSNPKRALAIKLAAQCGNYNAGKEYRRSLEEKIKQLRIDIAEIPDRRRVVWGSGAAMGTFVPRPSMYKLTFETSSLTSLSQARQEPQLHLAPSPTMMAGAMTSPCRRLAMTEILFLVATGKGPPLR